MDKQKNKNQNQNENLIQFGWKGNDFNSELGQGNVLVGKPRDLQKKSKPRNPFCIVSCFHNEVGSHTVRRYHWRGGCSSREVMKQA